IGPDFNNEFVVGEPCASRVVLKHAAEDVCRGDHAEAATGEQADLENAHVAAIAVVSQPRHLCRREQDGWPKVWRSGVWIEVHIRPRDVSRCRRDSRKRLHQKVGNASFYGRCRHGLCCLAAVAALATDALNSRTVMRTMPFGACFE